MITSEALAQVLKVLATPRRVQILRILCAEPDGISPSVIAASLGIGEGSTSFNLAKMEQHGLVLRRVCGRYALYHPNQVMLDLLVENLKPQGTTP